MESAKYLAVGFQTAFFELQMPTCTSVSISHGGDKVLQTCERYAPAEMFDLFCIEAVHHLGGTRTRQELHLCWKQLKVSCHNNKDMCSLLTMSGMLRYILHRHDFGMVALLVCTENNGRVDTSDS